MSAAPLYTFCSTISGRPFQCKSTTFKTAHYILVRGFPSENQSIIPKQNMPNAIKRHHFIYFLGWCVVSIPHFFCPPPIGKKPRTLSTKPSAKACQHRFGEKSELSFAMVLLLRSSSHWGQRNGTLPIGTNTVL